jgi:lipoprotein-releasing system permease protein
MGIFQRIDWLIAWRHLRAGDEYPGWVVPLLLGAVYLIGIGGSLAWYAVSLDGTAPPPDPLAPIEDLGPTSLQFYFGAFGGITLLVGVMALLFCLLARFFNLLPTIIAMSVLLGCMALVVVLSLMSGLEGDMRDKILNQKAHIRVARADGRPFDDYLSLSERLSAGQGIAGASPYLEGEIMVRSRLNRQGAILSGIVPELHARASNLPSIVRDGEYGYLEAPEDIPDPDPFAIDPESTPWRLRHLEKKKDKPADQLPSTTDPVEKRPAKDAPADVRLPPMLPAGEDDDGWEIPAVELGRATDDTKGDAKAKAGDDGWELPPPPAMAPGSSALRALGEAADAAAPPPVEEGWEVPSVELGLEPVDAPAEPDGPADRPVGDGPDNSDAIDNPVLIGSELAMELGIGLGVEVQLMTGIGRMTPAGRIPGILLAKVGGVFFSGMYEYDRKNVYVPLKIAQRFLLAGDRVSGIEVKLVDADRIDEGKARVTEIVAAAGRGDELIVEDWRDLNRNLFSAMFLEKVAMFIALLFVVLVASFGILASNLMSVMEKSKEIAILKAMGTSDRGILRVFVAEGLCVGVLGSMGGIGTGLGLCWALDRFGLPLPVYYVEKLPVLVNPAEVTLVGVAAMVIVCLSSLYPALMASRLRPVDALRQAEQ